MQSNIRTAFRAYQALPTAYLVLVRLEGEEGQPTAWGCQTMLEEIEKARDYAGLAVFIPRAAWLCQTRHHSHSIVAGGLLDTS